MRSEVKISKVQTGHHISSAISKPKIKEPPPGIIAPNEGDSNADTCCLGKNFIVLSYTTRTADVYPYDSSYKPIANVPIVSAGTAWDCPSSGLTYILVVNEGLYYGEKLDHSLLNPNQIRHNGIDFWDNPFDEEHNLSIEVDRGPYIPLSITGTKVYFQTRAPSQQELSSCPHVELTSILPWNPSTVKLGEVLSTRHDIALYEHDSWLYDVNPTLVMLKELSVRYIQSNTNNEDESHTDVPTRRTYISQDRHSKTSADAIADLCGIGPLRAGATMRATTQTLHVQLSSLSVGDIKPIGDSISSVSMEDSPQTLCIQISKVFMAINMHKSFLRRMVLQCVTR